MPLHQVGRKRIPPERLGNAFAGSAKLPFGDDHEYSASVFVLIFRMRNCAIS